MFNLTESTRGSSIWPWILHYLLGVITPVAAIDSFDAVTGFWNSGSAGRAGIDYFLLGSVAFVAGMASYLLHPPTASVARRTWIFPVSLFVLAVCWDLADGFTWQSTVSEYIVFLPGSTNSSEPWDGYFMFSFPALAAISYALGSRVAEARLVKARNPNSQTLD